MASFNNSQSPHAGISSKTRIAILKHYSLSQSQSTDLISCQSVSKYRLTNRLVRTRTRSRYQSLRCYEYGKNRFLSLTRALCDADSILILYRYNTHIWRFPRLPDALDVKRKYYIGNNPFWMWLLTLARQAHARIWYFPCRREFDNNSPFSVLFSRLNFCEYRVSRDSRTSACGSPFAVNLQD